MLARLLAPLLLLATAVVAVAVAEPMQIAVISDLNGSYGSTEYGADVDAAVKRIIALKPDLAISTGDMVAGQKVNPHLTDTQIAAMWKSFHTHVTEPLAKAGIPLLVTPGNHDASGYASFERERRAYDRTWTDHAPKANIIDGERFPFRYAVSENGVLMISLDVTTSGRLPAEEMEWLDQILTQESPRHRATILFSHLPLWPITQGRERDVIADPALQALLEKHKVTTYLSGHHQGYYPGVNGGVLFLAQACLGGGPRRLIGQTERSPKAFVMLDIDDAGELRQQALLAPAFTAVLPLSSLPKRIGPLTSADLAGH